MALGQASAAAACTADGGSSAGMPGCFHVLLVDGDLTSRKLIESMLLGHSYYKVTACSGGGEALSMLRNRTVKFDLVVSDVRLPDMDGFELLQFICDETDLPVFVTSANNEADLAVRSLLVGASLCLPKPPPDLLVKELWQFVERKKYERKMLACLLNEDF